MYYKWEVVDEEDIFESEDERLQEYLHEPKNVMGEEDWDMEHEEFDEFKRSIS